MTTREYEERNLKGYEGDTFVHPMIVSLCEKHSVTQIIETGTYLGGTTARLSEIRKTLTIEINPTNYERARVKLKDKNAIVKLGNSVDVLRSVLPSIKSEKILFFLDSHWGDYWPLLDELTLIAENGLNPVIVIHDFKVPGTTFGFDSYKGQALDINYINKHLDKIYPDGYQYEYNIEASGARRGLIYIYAK